MTERFDEPDPELEARLDALFRAEQPRPGFEAELWTRITAGHQAAPEESPLVRVSFRQRLSVWQFGAAAAAVLVVTVAGIGLSRLGGLPGVRTAGTAPSTESAPAGASGQAGFGRLPAPGAAAPRFGADTTATPAGHANPLVPRKTPSTSGVLNVYRWHEPGPAEAASFAGALGATPRQGQPPAGALGVYDLGPNVLEVLAGAPGAGPTFQLAVTRVGLPVAAPTPPSGQDATSRADSFLTSLHLAPTWPHQVSVSAGDRATVVTYQRTFGGAPEVDLDGRPRGLTVTVDMIGVMAVSGDLPLTLETSAYPMAAAPDGAALAYVAVPDGAFGYFEPVWLIGQAGGAVTFQPAISGAYIRP